MTSLPLRHFIPPLSAARIPIVARLRLPASFFGTLWKEVDPLDFRQKGSTGPVLAHGLWSVVDPAAPWAIGSGRCRAEDGNSHSSLLPQREWQRLHAFIGRFDEAALQELHQLCSNQDPPRDDRTKWVAKVLDQQIPSTLPEELTERENYELIGGHGVRARRSPLSHDTIKNRVTQMEAV